jgi:poly(3-hydroxybutyrate) depolymerase
MKIRTLQIFTASWFAVAILAWPAPVEAAKIQYLFKSWDGPALRVFATRPIGLAPDRPVVFVMHGRGRNADEYRDQWRDLAEEYNFLLLVPEFSKADFPGPERYNLGNVFDDNGQVNPKSEWSYTAIEKIFDDARSRFGMSVGSYSIYGHSAGAQFVHRFIFHVPDARVDQIVAANAGWYTMPDFNVAFPYGLQGSVVDRLDLAKSLDLPVTILLGDQDTDPNHSSLRRSPEAMEQGEHRFARGFAFFKMGSELATEVNTPFNWQMGIVEGADHDNRLMAPAAVPFLLAGRK